ncbi:hypothetical protein N0V82_005940 [Gnomoniopsis sp. IMI 355080]|nr:hypothetical protein N0V82_005940 [Gnomoniopsis sp. IMI 355080]
MQSSHSLLSNKHHNKSTFINTMEELQSNPPVATAAIPLLEGTRLRLIKSLQVDESYYTIAMQLPALADEAAQLPRYLLSQFADRKGNDNSISMQDVGANGKYKNRTEKYLRTSMEADWRNFVMFLSIPRPMLESIVLGTVAWDYDPERGLDRGHYKQAQQFGVYVVGLAVQGRKGAWLTATETQTLVKNMHKYLEAYDVWDEAGAWPLSASGQEHKDFVAKVDNQFGIHKHDVSRFITSANGREAMKDLLKGLEKRTERSLQLEPRGDVPMIQTPLYVGMSIELADRLPKHDPTKGINSILTSSNKPFVFVLSLMKFQGQEPSPKALCVVRVWERRDLYFAETLVSALAHSMVCQDGFNRTECGDVGKTSGMGYHEDGEDYVKYRSRFFYDNCKAVVQDLQARKSHLSDLAELQPVLDGRLVRSTEQVLEACKVLEQQMQDLEVQGQRLEKKIGEIERVNRELEEESNMLDLIGSWANFEM